MSKLKMLKFEAAALQSNSDNLIEQIQKIGVAQLESFTDRRLLEMGCDDSLRLCETNIDVVSNAMSILAEYGSDFGIGMFSGRKEISSEEYYKKSDRVDDVLDCCHEIIRLSKSLSDMGAERVRCITLRDSLTVWSELDIPLSGVTTRNTVAFAGTLSGQWSEEQLNNLISSALPEIREYSFRLLYSSAEITSVVFVCHKSVFNELSLFLRSVSFTAPAADDSCVSVAERLRELEENIAYLDEKIAQVRQNLYGFKDKSEDLKFAYDFYSVKRDEYTCLSDVKRSDRAVYLKGYVPEKVSGRLSRVISENDGAVVYSEPDENDDAPVLLSNGKFSEPCESIVEMFAIPGKNDIDPSKLMAFFYYLLFGMMLSDAGYGLVLGLGSFLLLKFTSVEGSMRKMLNMFVYCGISTVFWGALFGSWFGDAIPVIRREFFGVENPGGVALWFDPISDPIKLLIFSFAIGICHLFLGIFALGYMRWRDGDKVSAFCDTVPVILTVLGAAPLAAGVIISVPEPITNAAKYLAIAGVILIVLTSSRSGNIFARLFGGLYALYNTASGYLSDILSYSRLLALGLATGSIGSVVNMLAVMFEGPVIKEVAFVVIFIVGHTLNMAINVLGAYVHTNRLQFVELFSRFYEGGGRAFNPLKFNTKFFKLKEENKND